MDSRIIGIIGGMGPEATADLYLRITKATKVEKEQDHLRIIIDSNPKIPDRTKAILEKGESPLKAMIETGKNLEKLGVNVCCLPCITAHYFIDELQENLSFEILNALEEVNFHLKKNYPQKKNIGVLATMGTIKTQLFKKYLPDFNIIYPSEKTQREKVMEAIYGNEGIKKGYTEGKALSYLEEASKELVGKGAEIIIGGCTEVSLALKADYISVPFIDPMDILAKRVASKWEI